MRLSEANDKSGWKILTTTSEVGGFFHDNGFSDRLLVTFDALSEHNHLREHITGTNLAISCCADHLHIGTTLENWYQSPETEIALGQLQDFIKNYTDIITYGFSQGAYAALLMSGPLSATKVVAFAPQFSIDPRKVPFEQRFNKYYLNNNFCFDDMNKYVSKTADKYIIFDPRDEYDRQHFNMFKALPNIKPWPIPFASHFIGEFLRECGLVRQIAKDLISSPGRIPSYRIAIRENRRRSTRYLIALSLAMSRRGKQEEALELVNRAYQLDQSRPQTLEAYFTVLSMSHSHLGLAHAMLRLIMHEVPAWSFYEEKKTAVWQQLLNRPKAPTQTCKTAIRYSDFGAGENMGSTIERDTSVADNVGSGSPVTMLESVGEVETLRARLAVAEQREEAVRMVLRALIASLRPFGFDRKRFKRCIFEESQDTPDEGPASIRHNVLYQESRRVLREGR